MKRIFLCFAVPLLFVLYSCDSFDMDKNPPCKDSYWTEWTDVGLVYIVNDSLVVLSIHKYKKECGSYNMEVTKSSRVGLFLVNYKNKQKPLLGDTLELEDNLNYDLIISKGYFKDSSVLVLDYKNRKFGFLKIGEKSIRYSVHDEIIDFRNIGSMASPWIDGNIILCGYPTSYILNTEKGQIESFEPSEEYKWMYQIGWGLREDWFKKGNNYCLEEGFLSYIDDKIVCVKNNYSNNSVELIVDGVVTDTHLPFSTYRWLGSYINSENKSVGGVIKIDTLNLKFDKDFSLWIDENPLKFCKNGDRNPDDCVSYSGQDLINFKGDKP